ncbi:MAG: Vps62-related protein [Candidatus Pacebacteria bacterium]|nr:Vps62-related protein [Candidatus Paceibacterota bacterium]
MLFHKKIPGNSDKNGGKEVRVRRFAKIGSYVLISILIMFLFSCCGGKKSSSGPKLPVGFTDFKIPKLSTDSFLYFNQGTMVRIERDPIFSYEGNIDQVAFCLTAEKGNENLFVKTNGGIWQDLQNPNDPSGVSGEVSVQEGCPEAWKLINNLPAIPPEKMLGIGYFNFSDNLMNWYAKITQGDQTLAELKTQLGRLTINQVAIGLYSQDNLRAIDLKVMSGAGFSVLAVGKPSSFLGQVASKFLSSAGFEKDYIGGTEIYLTTTGDFKIAITNTDGLVYASAAVDVNVAKNLLGSVINQPELTSAISASGSISQQIAEKFAPIIYLHPDENYEPKSVNIIIDNAVLKDKKTKTLILLNHRLTASDLYDLPNSSNLYLDIPDFDIANSQSASYLQKYAGIKNNYPTTVYARVFVYQGKTVIQYWLFYFFNDGSLNKHEGDWEYVQLVFNGSDLNRILNSTFPEFAVYSQHFSWEAKYWREVAAVSAHPLVYVARGSHANYFSAGENTNVAFIDYTSFGGEIIFPQMKTRKEGLKNYELILLPDLNDPQKVQKEQPWISFQGNWGEWVSNANFDINGPDSPSKRDLWTIPKINK